LWAAAPATAAVVTLTYSGTVAAGADDLGVFGGDVAGHAFSAAFTFDTDNPARARDGDSDRIDGGTERGLPSFLTASLTIDGHTAQFTGGAVEAVVLTDGLVIALSSDTGAIGPPPDLLDPNVNVINLAIFARTGSLDLEQPAAWIARDSTGYFQLSHTEGDLVTRSWGALQVAQADTGGSFTPEPSAWALMILGFGVAGAALRQRVHA
jgi:hypothetical protein